jgi:hypothetical protein
VVHGQVEFVGSIELEGQLGKAICGYPLPVLFQSRDRRLEIVIFSGNEEPEPVLDDFSSELGADVIIKIGGVDPIWMFLNQPIILYIYFSFP